MPLACPRWLLTAADGPVCPCKESPLLTTAPSFTPWHPLQRKSTLLVEYKQLRKSNAFIDRRFGGASRGGGLGPAVALCTVQAVGAARVVCSTDATAAAAAGACAQAGVNGAG